MLCVKCGEEYEGVSCPRCEGPQILVNNDDYLRRRKAYEEKQAKGSASSSNKDASKGEEDFMVQLAGRVSKKVSESRKKSEAKRRADNKKVQTQEENEEYAENSPSIASRKKSINWRQCARVLVPAVVLIAMVVVLAVALFGEKQRAYVRFEGNLYMVHKGELELQCSDDNTFFTANGNTFYEAQWPDDYESGYVREKLASDKGKCFVAVVYDESAAKYEIVLMSEGVLNVVAESTMQLDVLYVSDKGCVVYTALDVLNEEGYSGAYELFVYEASNKKKPAEGGAVKQLTEALAHAYVCTKTEKVVFIDEQGCLSAYNYDGKGTVSYIADDVGRVYVMDNDDSDRYSYYSGYVSCNSAATGIIYSVGSKCYYADLVKSAQEHTYMGTITNAVTDIIYKKEEYMYFADSDKIFITKWERVINSDGNGYSTVLKTDQLDTIKSGANVEWLSRNNMLLYINSENALCSVAKGKIVKIDGTVSEYMRVHGSNQAVVYNKENVWYYKSGLESKASVINVPDNTYIEETVICNGKMYMVLSDDKLYTCKISGGDLEEIGSAEYIWLTSK